MEDEAMIEDCVRESFAILAKLERRREKILKRRKDLVMRLASEDLRVALEEEFFEGEIHSLSITKKKPHESYLESGSEPPRYVEQHCGCCEDDYYGSVWYQLSDRHWIKMDFAY